MTQKKQSLSIKIMHANKDSNIYRKNVQDNWLKKLW